MELKTNGQSEQIDKFDIDAERCRVFGTNLELNPKRCDAVCPS